MEIRTNNVPRFTLDGYELNAKERTEFDYIDWPAVDSGEDSVTFFRYKGQLYDLGEFITSPPEDANGWDAFAADTFFSGILIRVIEQDAVVVGMYFA